MNPKKYKTIMVIMVFIIILLCIGLAFLIINFLSSESKRSSNSDKPVFSSKIDDDFKIDTIDIEKEDNGLLFKNDTKLTVILTAVSNLKTTCTYDIIWEFSETMDVSNHYKKQGEMEFTVSGKTNNDSFSEIQLNDYTLDNRKTLLYTGKISANNNDIAKETWDIDINFYKLDVNQSLHDKKTYNGNIEVENVVCSSSNM